MQQRTTRKTVCKKIKKEFLFHKFLRLRTFSMVRVIAFSGFLHHSFSWSFSNLPRGKAKKLMKVEQSPSVGIDRHR